MARRRKNRTHLKGPVASPAADTPKSFVIKHGQVGSSIVQLVRDVRKLMEPNTASRLKVRFWPYEFRFFRYIVDNKGRSVIATNSKTISGWGPPSK